MKEITPRLSPFLDLHMMFPLLEFMDKQELVSYTSEEIARIRLQLLGMYSIVRLSVTHIFREVLIISIFAIFYFALKKDQHIW